MPRQSICAWAMGCAVLGMWLGACSPYAITKDLQLNPGAKTGLVIISTTVSGNPPENVTLAYRTLGGAEDRYLIVRNPFNNLDWGVKGADVAIPDTHPTGALVYAQLPPGRYEFHRWTAHGRGSGASSINPFSIQFDAVAGRVTYVGNIHIRFDDLRFRIAPVDQRDRDLALLRQKAPLIRPEQIDVKIMELQR